MTARDSPLITLEPGQSGLRIYTSQRDAAELSQQQAEGRVRRWLGDLGTEQLVEGLAMPLGEPLHAQQRTLVAQDGQDRHQQHPPLRKAHPTAHAAIGQRLEKADQIGCSSRVLERRGQRRKARLEQQTATADSPPGLLGQTSNGPWLAGGSEPGGVVSGAPVIPRMHRDWYWRTIGWVSRV